MMMMIMTWMGVPRDEDFDERGGVLWKWTLFTLTERQNTCVDVGSGGWLRWRIENVTQSQSANWLSCHIGAAESYLAPTVFFVLPTNAADVECASLCTFAPDSKCATSHIDGVVGGAYRWTEQTWIVHTRRFILACSAEASPTGENQSPSAFG